MIKRYLLLSLYLLFSFISFAGENPQAIKGIIDLSNWNQEETKLTHLHGEWDFYWQELLTPKDFKDGEVSNAISVKVPGNWNGEYEDGTILPAHGYGTYRLVVKVLNNKNYNLKISGVSTAYKIWVNNKVLGEVGKVDTSKTDYIPRLKPRIFNIIPDTNYLNGDTRSIEIIIQASNYYHVNSGIWEYVELASLENMYDSNQRANLFTAIMLGILIIMSLYHLALFFLRRNEYSALFFGLFTLTMAIRGATTDNRLILDIFSNFNFSLLVRLEYLSAYTNIIFASLFFNALFKEDFNKRVLQVFLVLGVIITLIISFAPMNIFTSLRDVYNVFVLLCGIYITFFALTKAMIKKRKDSSMAFIGMFFLFGTGVFDIISTVANLSIPSTAPTGLVFYVLIQSYILSHRYSTAFTQNASLTEELNYQNKNLESIVDERTSEVNKQKKELEDHQIILKDNIEELAAADEELRQNNEALYTLNRNIESAHKNITSSIQYSKRIQNALLPSTDIFNILLPDNFIFFKPKEAVSGDFYYLNKSDDTVVFAAADCTGHGVPGAFMTILSITFLNEVIKRDKTIIPSDILEQLRFRIKSIFAQFGSKNQNGLDIALCALNTKNNTLQYAGANNPLWIIRDGEIIEQKATRAPIGNYPKMINFDNNEIELQDGDIIYLFSDGFQDQFGGEKNRKFSKKQFRELLLSNAHLTMNEQKDLLEKTISIWMADYHQIDDMVILGIKHKLR